MKYIEELITYQEDIDATQIAEILWLSQFMVGESSKIEEPKPTPNRKSQEIKEPIKDLPPIEESETINHTPTPQKQKTNYGFDKEQEGSTYSTHIHKKEKFPNIEKQFSSLRVKQKQISKKSIDEIKTADYIATTGYFHPIFSEVKSKGSYFTLHIIIDRSESIFLWESYTQHFIKSMKFSKTFKKIHIFELNSSQKEPSITILNSHSININSATFREDKSLTLVFSDITGISWKSNRMFEILDNWSKGSFVAIVSMLPKRMWRKTPLRQGISLFMKPTRFLPKNRNLKAEFDFIGIKPNQKATNIPILTFDSYAFSNLSNILISKKNSQIDTRIFKNITIKEVAKPKKSNISPSQRVKNFFSFALPKTRELAIYCSVLPLNNEIIREVIKARDLGNEKDVFAEFYFSGLLDKDAKAPLGEYAFYNGVAKELRQYISIQEFEILLGQVSSIMSSSFGIDYQKINLLYESNNSDIELNNNEKALVELIIEVLGDKGRFYEGEVERLEEIIKIQRLKEENLIFSTILQSKQIYINREVDDLLYNKIAQKKGCVLFLHGQGGIGKSTLLEKFSRSDRPTIFIHINERVDMSMVDIFLDENRTTVRNCPKFEAKLDEIFFEREENNKTPFKAEFELLEAIREDFGEHGVFIVDTFEKSKNSHITSRVKFDGDRVRFTRADSFSRFKEYLERLIYLFVPHTTFIIAGRNRIGDVNEKRDERFLDIDDVEEIKMQNFSAIDIQRYIMEHKLPSPTKEQLDDIEKLTHGNPLLIYLLMGVIQREYRSWSELDYSEMREIVYKDEDYGLIFYFTKRILSHIDIDDIWKLVIPRVLSREIERLLFEDKRVFEELVDVGLLYRGERRNLYKLHDDVAMAIESYAKKELGSYKLASWHDNKDVIKIHRILMEFYKSSQNLENINSNFEACYHNIMLKTNFENEFNMDREYFANFLLDSDYNKFCKEFDTLSNFQIIQLQEIMFLQ